MAVDTLDGRSAGHRRRRDHAIVLRHQRAHWARFFLFHASIRSRHVVRSRYLASEVVVASMVKRLVLDGAVFGTACSRASDRAGHANRGMGAKAEIRSDRDVLEWVHRCGAALDLLAELQGQTSLDWFYFTYPLVFPFIGAIAADFAFWAPMERPLGIIPKLAICAILVGALACFDGVIHGLQFLPQRPLVQATVFGLIYGAIVALTFPRALRLWGGLAALSICFGILNDQSRSIFAGDMLIGSRRRGRGGRRPPLLTRREKIAWSRFRPGLHVG